ncbi:hypothetical protein [Oceanobacillus chungangensis]|uniref:Uncharacterized protein n=1 Tax=Oceanobacillus chungangensis TaxID=1229152 RepID=A0A3D8PUW9_9BACI|nr:hypothetical protein [Oceanobacillus chungangensis]RDW19960.1 hypothetical protein CWR45_07845 [Oceanobacillus chungangensis]
MSVLVINCNHWIGYHIVNTLLQHDYLVDGIESDTELDELSMFFGRNSSFSFYNIEDRKRYDTCICVGEHGHLETIDAERVFIINPGKMNDWMDYDTATMIFAAHLYGEWMPMTEKGFYDNQEFIAFQSNDFKENAIYIEDFANGLIQWIQSSNLSSNLEVKSERNNGKVNKENQNSIYIRSSLPLEKRMTALQKHYQLIQRKKNMR